MYELIKKTTSLLSIIIGCAVSAALIVSFAKGFNIETFGKGLYPSYTHVYDILGKLSEADMGQYRLLILLDSLFAVAHGLTCAFIIVYLFDVKTVKGGLARKLVLLPMGTMVLDLCENCLSFIILAAHPEKTFVAHIIGTVTLTKWTVVGLNYTAIVCGLVWFVVFILTSQRAS